MAVSFFVGEELFGCKLKARTRLAFALFFVGILNSFTNYGHHTYHLPQSHYIKWFAFIVSMTEIIIFAKVCLDMVTASKSLRTCGAHKTAALFFVFGTIWTWIQLGGSLFMSWPSLNSLVHGTPVIASHAMGTMIGIDSMLLWGVVFFLLSKMYPARMEALNTRKVRGWVITSNGFLFVFWLALLIKGLNFGWNRFTGTEFWFSPYIDQYFPLVFALVGTGLTLSCLAFLIPVLRTLFIRRTRPVEMGSVQNLKNLSNGRST
jgi:nitric oxide reductase subunit B